MMKKLIFSLFTLFSVFFISCEETIKVDLIDELQFDNPYIEIIGMKRFSNGKEYSYSLIHTSLDEPDRYSSFQSIIYSTPGDYNSIDSETLIDNPTVYDIERENNKIIALKINGISYKIK